MVGRKNREAAESTFEPDMTPMIDVTFNLLIFFLCNVHFKLLEGKIPAYLPRDVGVNTVPVDRQVEKVEIQVARRDTSIDRRTAWVWDESQIEIRVQGRRMSGLRELHDTIRKLREADPEAKATLRPAPGTLYIDSVKVVNECLRAKLVNLTFAGAATRR
jgi:biopolymer transport protein ExbD